MSSIEETKGIQAAMIIEVLGRPPEHLKETLESIIKSIDEEKSVNVISKKISDAQLMKDQKDIYMSFAEVEVEVEGILQIVILMFKYMPANIEIIYPEGIMLTNTGWNDVLNELSRRLHGYDEITRIAQVEKDILERKLREVLENQGSIKEVKIPKKKGSKKKTVKKGVKKK